jgi:hypothetical protein
LVNQAVKKHSKKPPKKEERPKTAKKAHKEIIIDDNNENDYEEFVNGMSSSILQFPIYLYFLVCLC